MDVSTPTPRRRSCNRAAEHALPCAHAVLTRTHAMCGSTGHRASHRPSSQTLFSRPFLLACPWRRCLAAATPLFVGGPHFFQSSNCRLAVGVLFVLPSAGLVCACACLFLFVPLFADAPRDHRRRCRRQNAIKCWQVQEMPCCFCATLCQTRQRSKKKKKGPCAHTRKDKKIEENGHG
ncbi:hypothetical protein TW95_gp1433 [Pandoravirus inopinatum]|uniref:Transmembrane protein n=1 Tax=Pandoravirus inopinatum TaxID=1605721 RepID=A0A0B5JEI0_9VIRU|nr:hypothetical protein TW95_gp1433 [Pandoravirus inopinatum]AJF98167.1 hypothetical protein [Pandoravirus inopinatum]